MGKPYLVKVRGIKDLVNVAVATQIFMVHKLSTETTDILYVPFPSYDSVAVYYCEANERVNGKYLLFNRFTGEVSVSDSFTNDSKYVLIPIIEVVEQEILPKEFLERYQRRRKKAKRRQSA